MRTAVPTRIRCSPIPAGCTGALQPNPGFDPLLGCYDLTRTGTLPASDGCPTSTSGLYTYNGHANIRELALLPAGHHHLKNWTFNLGIRGDIYNGIPSASQAEPRLGVVIQHQADQHGAAGFLCAHLETPFNENLVLSSGAATTRWSTRSCRRSRLSLPDTRRCGRAGATSSTLGLQQAFGQVPGGGRRVHLEVHAPGLRFQRVSATRRSRFRSSGHNSKIPGYAIRASMPNFHGLSAFVVMSSVAARFFTPQVAASARRRERSDACSASTTTRRFNQTTHLQYQPWKDGPWIGFNWRYDSGLVAGPVPCAGGNCANGPNGTTRIVDVSGLTPDQQFEAGLFCGSVHATPTTPISPTVCARRRSTARRWLQIPAAGTENDDHNPPRIAPRNLFDMAIGARQYVPRRRATNGARGFRWST